jgi:hypothetical protein
MPRVQSKKSGAIEPKDWTKDIKELNEDLLDLTKRVYSNENWLLATFWIAISIIICGLIVWFGPYSTNQEAMAAELRATNMHADQVIGTQWNIYNSLSGKIGSLNDRLCKLEPTPKPTPAPTPNPCQQQIRACKDWVYPGGGQTWYWSETCNCWENWYRR